MAEDTGLASADVGAGDDATATQYNNLVTDVKKIRQESMTAGETINGATLPVPVFQNTSDNEVYASDADDTTRLNFIGFAITNGTDGNAIIIQHTGVVGGFSALVEGEKYYVTNTVGGINTTPGAVKIFVGFAISTTQILIMNKEPVDDIILKLLTGGETLSGATLPVPVFQNTSDNEFYASDTNDITRLKFQGFLITDTSDANDAVIQFNGIVDGFSTLDEGEKYYVQNVGGTIDKTPGRAKILVGVAVSPTELLITKGESNKLFKTGQSLRAVSSTGNQVVTHGLGFVPKYIQIYAMSETDTANQAQSISIGTATGIGDETCTSMGGGGSVHLSSQNATHIISLLDAAGNIEASATLSAIGEDTFTLNWDVNSALNNSRKFQWTVWG